MNGMNEEELKKQKLLETIRPIIAEIMEKPARERLNNIRAVKPDFATQIELYLAQLYQSGKLRQKIGDDELKEILKALNKKKDFNIRRL